MKNRPITTLFMLMSVDGKISTGETDELDFDQDLPKISGVKEGLHQYYDIEQTTDLWSLNSGKVMAKIGINKRKPPTSKTPVSFVLIDNYHLQYEGIRYFCLYAKNVIVVTQNKSHPAFDAKNEYENLNIILQNKLDLSDMFKKLKLFGCNKITIQTGGTINGLLLRDKLIDYIDIVVAPVLVGGKNTPTLIDAESITANQLSELGILKLKDVSILKSSYIRLQYKVINSK